MEWSGSGSILATGDEMMFRSGDSYSRKESIGQKNWTPYLYILPALLIYGIFILLPVLETIGYSFTQWDGATPPQYIGFNNYLNLVHDDVFLTSAINNLKFIPFYTILPMA